MLFKKDGIRKLHTWTHESLDLVFHHAGTLPLELLYREIPGFGAATVHAQLLHVLAAEARWLRRLQNLPATQWPESEYTTLAALMDAKRHVVTDTIAYLDGLSEAELNTELQHDPTDWIGPLRSPAFILHHVLTHAFHHKGQVVAMFRILGYPAPDTDLQREPG